VCRPNMCRTTYLPVSNPSNPKVNRTKSIYDKSTTHVSGCVCLLGRRRLSTTHGKRLLVFQKCIDTEYAAAARMLPNILLQSDSLHIEPASTQRWCICPSSCFNDAACVNAGRKTRTRQHSWTPIEPHCTCQQSRWALPQLS
jgi:hypothetical protein